MTSKEASAAVLALRKSDTDRCFHYNKEQRSDGEWVVYERNANSALYGGLNHTSAIYTTRGEVKIKLMRRAHGRDATTAEAKR